jgi:hypothetical protein
MKVPVALPGYKVAYLLWPESNTSNPDGEIDWPEQNLDGLGTATTFMHWQVIAGNTGQSSAGSSVDLVDALDWKVFDIEWRPNQANPASSTLKTHVDGVLIGNFTGVKVPIHRMHWSWQNETFLTHSGMIDDTSDGYLQVAWGTYETMV